MTSEVGKYKINNLKPSGGVPKGSDGVVAPIGPIGVPPPIPPACVYFILLSLARWHLPRDCRLQLTFASSRRYNPVDQVACCWRAACPRIILLERVGVTKGTERTHSRASASSFPGFLLCKRPAGGCRGWSS